MKHAALLLIVIALIHHFSHATSFSSWDKKETTIEFKTSKENLFKEENRKVLKFKLTAKFNDTELKVWIASVKSDQYVKSVVVGEGSDEKGWDVKVVLKEPINKNIAKTLFSFSLKTDYIIVEQEKILFNVFISKYVPN